VRLDHRAAKLTHRNGERGARPERRAFRTAGPRACRRAAAWT
jgi:hypothetical protein